MRQDQLNVIFEEIHHFTESLVAKLMALDGEKPPKAKAPKAPKASTVPAKKPVKVTNGTRGRARTELSRAEAATYLDVHEATIANLSARGALPAGHVKDGKGMKLFYYQADLDAYRRTKDGAA